MNNQLPTTSCAATTNPRTQSKLTTIKKAFAKTKHHLLPAAIVLLVTGWFIGCGFIVEGNYCSFFAERCLDGQVLKPAPFVANAFVGGILIAICSVGAAAIMLGILAVVFKSFEFVCDFIIRPTAKFFIEFTKEISNISK